MGMARYKAQVKELQEEIASLEYAMAHVVAIEAGCSSIPVEWQEIGGIRVGLDAAGNAVRVEILDGLQNLYGWDME